jgi:hypothetical protein
LGQLVSALCLTICLSAVSAGADAPIDAEDMRIAERLARAIRIESVSHEDPADFRGGPFLELAALLRETYGRICEDRHGNGPPRGPALMRPAQMVGLTGMLKE